MTIEYDPQCRRSTHVESGLAVEWVRDEPAQERRSHFKVMAGGRACSFEASIFGLAEKILKEENNISGLELNKRMAERRRKSNIIEIEYVASNIDLDFDRDTFVDVWAHLLKSMGGEVTVFTTRYVEMNLSNGRVERE